MTNRLVGMAQQKMSSLR
ncbi:hypothetical protein CUU66_10310 [Peribacillus deserti]|uniref:Uncharacterized protein n=1 Tax=Peribacillus deserti TaxID=673318 RepID=A0A2N5M6J1_9BACI|nr:hypothetical protein CUU66_10310 [Peribacillus deserti]